MSWGQVVKVKYPDLEHSEIGTKTKVGHSYYRGQLQEEMKGTNSLPLCGKSFRFSRCELNYIADVQGKIHPISAIQHIKM